MAEYRNLATTADGGVAVNGKPLDLTPYECKALRLLVEDAAAGKQLTTLTHLDVIAPPRAAAPMSNSLQVIMYRLRRKLLNADAGLTIKSVRERGYCLLAAPRADGIQKGNADLVPALNQTLGPAL